MKISWNHYLVRFIFHHFNMFHLINRLIPYLLLLHFDRGLGSIFHHDLSQILVSIVVFIEGCQGRGTLLSLRSDMEEGRLRQESIWNFVRAWLVWFCLWVCCWVQGMDWCWLRWAKRYNLCRSWNQVQKFRSYVKRY